MRLGAPRTSWAAHDGSAASAPAAFIRYPARDAPSAPGRRRAWAQVEPTWPRFCRRSRGREAQREAGEFAGSWFMNAGEEKASPNRSWDDCKRYGFMLAGGDWRIEVLRKLRKGDRLFAYLNGHGYVGCGEVIAEAVPQRDFVPPGQSRRLIDLPLKSRPDPDALSDPKRCDWCVAVRWLKAVDRDEAVLKNRSRRPAVERIRQPELVRELCKHLGVELPAIDADMP